MPVSIKFPAGTSPRGTHLTFDVYLRERVHNSIGISNQKWPLLVAIKLKNGRSNHEIIAIPITFTSQWITPPPPFIVLRAVCCNSCAALSANSRWGMENFIAQLKCRCRCYFYFHPPRYNSPSCLLSVHRQPPAMQSNRFFVNLLYYHSETRGSAASFHLRPLSSWACWRGCALLMCVVNNRAFGLITH